MLLLGKRFGGLGGKEYICGRKLKMNGYAELIG